MLLTSSHPEIHPIHPLIEPLHYGSSMELPIENGGCGENISNSHFPLGLTHSALCYIRLWCVILHVPILTICSNISSYICSSCSNLDYWLSHSLFQVGCCLSQSHVPILIIVCLSLCSRLAGRRDDGPDGEIPIEQQSFLHSKCKQPIHNWEVFFLKEN